mgnify:CR=1 FL=1|tara:strand:+ start:9569 stop:10510 length:942 start_codon:yes stop_codon:yes gene_type:complete
MNFYNNNETQDRLFMEIQIKYHLSYWIASDVDHFVENFSDLLSESDFNNLREQYIFALDIFKDANKRAFLLNGRHRSCEHTISKYIKKCLNDFKYPKLIDSIDSESEEIAMLEIISSHNEFSRDYIKYLSGGDMELYVINSYTFFSKAFTKMMCLNSLLDKKNEDESLKVAHEIVSDLNTAKSILDQCLATKNWVDALIDEILIISSSRPSKKDVSKFLESNIEFLQLWKELYFIYSEFYSNLIETGFGYDEVEYSIMSFESIKYLGKININAIKNCYIILDMMNINIPQVEIFSIRTIKNPLTYISNTSSYE